jgi:transcription elongation factor GreA
MPQNNEVMMTYEGLKKLEEELEYLKTEKRKEISERIKVALGYGDLSENSEYDEAKTEQAQVEMKIVELENTLRNAKVIDEDEVDNKIVQVGNKVKVHDMEYDEDVEYTIVGPTEVNLAENKISNESPIGKALLGKKKNEIADAVLDNGEVLKFKVVKISFGL